MSSPRIVTIVRLKNYCVPWLISQTIQRNHVKSFILATKLWSVSYSYLLDLSVFKDRDRLCPCDFFVLPPILSWEDKDTIGQLTLSQSTKAPAQHCLSRNVYCPCLSLSTTILSILGVGNQQVVNRPSLLQPPVIVMSTHFMFLFFYWIANGLGSN